ncbi:MAG: TIGR03747 family integrating conjugative element membrane protein [Pseudomonadales bacterium]|nr:TIGR03747 family integrating conjugative element membrane protein [Pseudomonadales bacterium]
MTTRQPYAPPKRKEPGLIGNSISAMVQLLTWLLVSWLLSVAIEWLGMAYWWTDQQAEHARSVFESDLAYLHPSLTKNSHSLKQRITRWTDQSVQAVANISWPTYEKVGRGTGIHSSLIALRHWLLRLVSRYQDQLLAAQWVTQTFIVRLVLILFSIPLFFSLIIVGAVDGLVERDLRRWGGGRESSNVFNLARQSITPAFVSACVIYISLPYSINPSWVILPFAVLQGLAVRVTLERLKKYF